MLRTKEEEGPHEEVVGRFPNKTSDTVVGRFAW